MDIAHPNAKKQILLETYLINVEIDFINAKKKKSIIVKFKHEKAYRFDF